MNTAIVVGINQYATTPLQFAVQDAIAIADVLEKCVPPFQVTLLTDEQATGEQISAALDALDADENGTAVIYFAGHAGLTEEDARFLPFDATSWDECVAFDEIATAAKRVLHGKRSIVVILDCCHAGALEIDTFFSQKNYREAISGTLKDVNAASLLACTVGASAREDAALGHGVFTYFILRGMNGAAADSDGVVSTDGLYRYVSKEMEQLSYGKPAHKASVSGRFRITTTASRPSSPASIQHAMTVDIDSLRKMLEKTDEKLALLRPPFASRDQWRDTGWLEASKIVEATAAKRRSLQSKWSSHLDNSTAWGPINDDVSGLIGDLATVGTGTVTEFGRITRKIGDGGFGNVYEVVSDTGTSLAFKVFHSRDLDNRAKLERFRIGYRAMNQLAHPKIVKVHKSVESPVSFFMEFIAGQNLRRWYGAEQDPTELVRIMIEITQVVEYAHGMGVLHRDIKPENVIIRWSSTLNRWEPVLTDFDLAWFESATSHTVEAFGAPFYAAPEQLSDPGKSVAHQPAVDVYALTMLILYAVTGKDPSSVEDALDQFRRRVNAWPSRSAADQIYPLIVMGSTRNPDKRLVTTRDIRNTLIGVREKMLASAQPGAPLDVKDFVGCVESILGQPTKPLGSNEYVGKSMSGRVDFTLRWHGNLAELELSKLDGYAAVGLSNAQARESMVRRLSADIERMKAGDPNLARIYRSGGSNTRIEFRGLPQTSSGAASVARLIAELVATYERF